MPRGIFWSGIVASALFALLAAAWGLAVGFRGGVPLPGSDSWMEHSGTQFAVGALFLTLPLSALLLRMAARLASRRIFDAIVTVFAVTGAAVLTLASALLLSPLFDDDVLRIASGGLSLAVLFAALGVLSLRSYFEVQSSRTLSILVSLPLPLALGFTVTLTTSSASAETLLTRALFAALALTTASAFAAIAVHAVRHRQMFLETSGLRDLLVHSGRQRIEGDDDTLTFGEPLADG